MANATAVVKEVTLRMTSEEAQTLADITDFIGGHPSLSRRRHVDAIRKALEAVGIVVPDDVPDVSDDVRAVYFNREEK